MPINTPEPRLPLEPEEYPLYKPPRRVGCSGLTIVTVIAVLAFAFLLARVTPQWAKGITDIPRALLPGSDATADTTPGTGALATQTVIVTAAATQVPTPKATPVAEYVRLANTGGQGVKLRVEPKPDAKNVVSVGEGAVFKVIGPDVTTSLGTWRRVELPGDGRSGYVLANFLIPTSAP